MCMLDIGPQNHKWKQILFRKRLVGDLLVAKITNKRSRGTMPTWAEGWSCWAYRLVDRPVAVEVDGATEGHGGETDLRDPADPFPHRGALAVVVDHGAH